jgi:hypothetical protein
MGLVYHQPGNQETIHGAETPFRDAEKILKSLVESELPTCTGTLWTVIKKLMHNSATWKRCRAGFQI